MFFLQKDGVYGHGVWWIGKDKKEGIKEADKMASFDCDSWHDWTVYEFVPVEGNETVLKHKKVYSTKKGK